MEITVKYQQARNLGISDQHAKALDGMVITDVQHFHSIHRDMLSKARSCSVHNDQSKADVLYTLASMLRMYYDSVAWKTPPSER